MTLADPTVQRLLQRDFVATWGNVEGEPSAGASFAHRPADAPGTCVRGNGEHNIQVLVLTAGGELLGVTAGFLSAGDLRAELEGMRELDEALARATRVERLTEDERRQFVRDAHERMLEELAERSFDGPLLDWARRRALADRRFAARNALLPARQFRTVDLVGNARTFFGSSSGGRPRDGIGEGPEGPGVPEVPETGAGRKRGGGGR